MSYLCEECGSTDVEVKAWIKPNVSEYGGDSIEMTAILDDVRATLEWIEIQVDGDWEDEGNQEVD